MTEIKTQKEAISLLKDLIELSEEDMDGISYLANKSYENYRKGIRGQTMSEMNSRDWHVINETLKLINSRRK